jgi:hypothetical protein
MRMWTPTLSKIGKSLGLAPLKLELRVNTLPDMGNERRRGFVHFAQLNWKRVCKGTNSHARPEDCGDLLQSICLGTLHGLLQSPAGENSAAASAGGSPGRHVVIVNKYST